MPEKNNLIRRDSAVFNGTFLTAVNSCKNKHLENQYSRSMQNRNKVAPITWALLPVFHTYYLFIRVSVLVNCTPSAGLSGIFLGASWWGFRRKNQVPNLLDRLKIYLTASLNNRKLGGDVRRTFKICVTDIKPEKTSSEIYNPPSPSAGLHIFLPGNLSDLSGGTVIL